MNRIAIATAQWTDGDGTERERQFNDKPLKEMLKGALIIYGYGHDLGDFKQFAESLKKN